MKYKSTSIALLGTSADPPTYGHQALLSGLLTLFPKVITWASDNPMKTHKTSLNVRHKLLNALVTDMGNPQLEVVQQLSSPWTIKTLEIANQLWPRDNFIFVVGSDLIKQIPHWHKARILLEKTRIGIAVREGWPLIERELLDIENIGGEIELLPLEIPGSSSSDLREKQKIAEIPKAILPLILEQNLYGLHKITK